MAASLTIFVCSTFGDLSQEREGVLDAVRRLKLKHDSMEFFGARATQPLETCLQEVRASDVLVVIVGHRYGSIVPELGISYTEAEYSEAFRLKKPCLIYMRDDNVPILPKHMERDPEGLRLLEKWKGTLQSRHTVAPFQDASRLAVQVAADLARTLQDLEEVAKARASAITDSGTTLLAEVATVITDALNQGVPEASVLSSIRSSVSALLSARQKREPTVFLSHAHADADFVRQVAAGLQAAGIQVWFDTLLQAGTNSMQEIERELSAADFVAFFISPNSVGSGWQKQELAVALHRQLSGEGGAVILPVMLKDADVPPLLRQYQWIDVRDSNVERGVSKLLEAIHRREDPPFSRFAMLIKSLPAAEARAEYLLKTLAPAEVVQRLMVEGYGSAMAESAVFTAAGRADRSEDIS
ncbi:MAG TPA: TIR domain-containing protein [Casimicrobiaceae bacterium]